MVLLRSRLRWTRLLWCWRDEDEFVVLPAAAAAVAEGDHKHTPAVDTSFPGRLFRGRGARRFVPLQFYPE